MGGALSGPSGLTGLSAIVGSGGGAPFVPTAPTLLLDDQFTTPVAATLASPRTCEPGPGTISIATPGASIISGGNFDSTPTASNTPTVYDTTLRAELTGLAMACLGLGATGSGLTHAAGWDENASGSPTIGMRKGITGKPTNITGVEVFLDLDDMSTANDKWLVSVRLGSGWYVNFVRASSGNWYILDMAKQTPGTSMHAGFRDAASSGGVQVSRLMVAQLFDDFATLFSWADINEAPAAGPTTLMASADFVCMIDLSTNPTGAERVELKFREQDANNYWLWQLAGAADANSSYMKRIEGGVEVFSTSQARASGTGQFMITAYGAEINTIDCQTKLTLNNLLVSTFETATLHTYTKPASAVVDRLVACRGPLSGNAPTILNALIAL